MSGDETRTQIHATCVALGGVGVVIRGPSGGGKSDLALRLIDAGARLVADDRVDLGRDGDAVVAAPPAALAGLLEVRGIGIVEMAFEASATVGVIVDLIGADAVERLPEPATAALLGVALPVHRLDPFEASAAAKVRVAAGLAAGHIMRR
ncbi:MAG: HPr kinase/phosphatase C-terminal domain-containing protein [Magnetovibrio sp.]|nr:HPr kinase/phosphatase C-terminal domain-containing protein [Magnetovibrio sp.]